MPYKTGEWGEKAKARSQKRKAYFTTYHINRKLNKYSMTEDEYHRMFTEQKGLCAICGKEETAKYSNDKTKVKKLSVDHCHSTLKVRGLLCFLCNRGLGYFKDDKNLLTNAIKYLSKS